MARPSRSFARPWVLFFAAAAALAGTPARGFEVWSAGDAHIRWDNTLKYSTAVRLSEPTRDLIRNPNIDDGNRSFHPGFISNRADLLSELDITARDWGAAASAAAWYDTVYNARPDPDTTRPPSLYPVRRNFASSVRRLHGRNVELLNAFVYGTFNAHGRTVSLRAGRHNLLWGESLFFAGNSIAAAQAPIDAIKALSVPLSRAREVFMPVAQISASAQATEALTIAAYYQLEWRKSRLPGAGSYFSAADFVDAGGYRLYVGRDQHLGRDTDLSASDSGQFGLAFRLTRGNGDFGLYALRFHAKEPQLYIRPYGAPESAAAIERPAAYGTAPGGVYAGPLNPLQSPVPYDFGDAIGEVGHYQLVYPRGIEVYGASFSGYAGESNIAGEVSVRRRMPLASTALVATYNTRADGDKNPLYALGDTVHAQVSTITNIAPNRFWDSASVSAEIAMNGRLNVTRNAAVLDSTRDAFAATMRALFEPTFFAVAPGLDLSLPVSMGYGLAGDSSVDAGQNAGAGSVELGLSAVYRAVWRASITMTHFIGDVSRQPFADRNFISLSVQTTF